MKRLAKHISLLFSVFALAACGGTSVSTDTTSGSTDATSSQAAPKNKVSSESLYVKKVDNLPNDFIFGMDASSVPSLEKSGVKFYDFDGSEKDVFEILSHNGVNYIRVRVWNDPFDAEGHGYGGGNCDINVAKEIGLRATKAGMKLLVDFHYSDFWADPAKYQAPKAWANMSAEEKGEACYEYTKQSLQLLKDAKIDVGMVQVGNETNNGIAGETTWLNRWRIMDGGSRATREVFPDALVAVHFANPEKPQNYENWASKLAYYELDYDVFGTSYYPYWHGTLDNLSSILTKIAGEYGKKTMVLETSYANTNEDTDFYGNTIGESASGEYPFTLSGQANHMRNLTDTIVNRTNNSGIGVCYWEGTWISVGTNSWEENVEKWKEYGSGWTSEYSASYESEDAGYNGGSAVDNQCFFDKNGKVLESLKVFGMMAEGNVTELRADGVENPVATMYTYDSAFQLPSTVNLIYNDNSRKAVPVTWDAFDLEQARAAGNNTYYIKGVSDGFDVELTLHVLEYNFIQNYSFEDGIDPWRVTKRSADKLGDSYKNEITNENPKSGDFAYHFWASASNTAGFDMEQDVTIETAGTYKYSFCLMGGIASGTPDPEKQDIYGYVKVNDEIVKKVDAKFTGYSKTYENGTFLIEGLELDPSQKITVGIHLFANESGSWGDVDDFMLNIVL